jgi:ABC-type multidrug transport system fused ATPase/permease subunit
MANFLHKFLYVLQGKYKSLAFLLFLFLLTSFLEVVGIGMVGPFIALATNPGAIHQNPFLSTFYNRFHFASELQFLFLIGLVVVIIFYVKAFLNFNAQKYIFEFGFGQQGELSYRLMSSYLSAPYTFHLTRNSASVIQNIISETERFANGLMMPLLTSVSNGVIALALVGLLIRTNAMAVIIVSAVFLVAFAMLYGLRHRLKRWGMDGSEARTEMIRTINHGLGGLKETKVLGCESHFEDQMQEQVQKFSTSAALATSFTNLPRFTVEAFLITFLIIFTVLFISSEQGNPQNLNSVLGIFALASIRLLPAVSNILSSINGVRYNAFSLDQIYSDFRELEEASKKQRFPVLLDRSNAVRKTMSFADEILLDSIFYRYPNAGKNSLEEISLTISKGQSIGFIGKSGAGKTTMVDVILGLLTPQSGDILVDGVSIYRNLRAWQNMIGYVPQSIFLIDDTLKRNIAFGVPDRLIDQNRLLQAVDAAQLSDLVKELAQGLDTNVGERGVLLSGGQRQRVGIARALYHEREILVFDEATAALDNETEALVTEAIKSLSGTKTMIIIAHRLSTIEHCDRIYMLEKGKVIKSGTYQEVVSRK